MGHFGVKCFLGTLPKTIWGPCPKKPKDISSGSWQFKFVTFVFKHFQENKHEISHKNMSYGLNLFLTLGKKIWG